MKFQFPNKSNADIIATIKQALSGRGLNDLVSLEDEGSQILLKISKLGTSVLTFERKDVGDKTELSLVNEKIAFAHKAFKDDVKDKFMNVIQKAGGSIIPS